MKKIFALVLAALLAFALTACGGTDEKPADATQPASGDTTLYADAGGEAVVGGFTDAASPVITDDFRQVFAKAVGTLAGMEYEPYAYLASQVVAGTNHLVLCKATPTVPDAVTTYALVTVYEDLNGGAGIIDVKDSAAVAPAPYDEENPVSGGWGEPGSPEVTDAARDALAKAGESYDGADFEPRALLGMQVVAGMNYDILCRVTPAVPGAEPYYAVVTVYADLDGGAEITAAEEFASDADGTSGDGAVSASSQAG